VRKSWCSTITLTLSLIFASAAAAEPGVADAPAPEAAPETPATDTPATTPQDVRESICLMIESAAKANDLPLEFFARVIWQESRFNADAVGPRTRSGSKAQGIAQFMPRTAAERGLLDPFDPVQALPKSAEFLRELRDKFGNLGLAAAAYNAGPQRVRDWMSGARTLPSETRNYVAAITGISVDEWASGGKREPREPIPNCRQMMALLKRAPNPFVTKLEERVAVGAAKPWGIQLSAGFSKDHALAAYASIANRYAQLLAGQDPTILSGILRSRGTRTFYQVRVGADTRDAANGLCAAIQRAGGACLVLRNRAS
jgi:transglycosylase-like protein with SLT domain/sporulation related protein